MFSKIFSRILRVALVLGVLVGSAAAAQAFPFWDLGRGNSSAPAVVTKPGVFSEAWSFLTGLFTGGQERSAPKEKAIPVSDPDAGGGYNENSGLIDPDGNH